MNEHFVPVKIHIKERKQDFGRFKVEWTPTLVLSEADGTERYRFEGYLPPEEFAARIQLGLAKAAFGRGEFEHAHRAFETVVSRFVRTDAVPEAIYWSGVSQYKATGKPEFLKEAGLKLKQKYPQSEWAKKGSVWVA